MFSGFVTSGRGAAAILLPVVRYCTACSCSCICAASCKISAAAEKVAASALAMVEYTLLQDLQDLLVRLLCLQQCSQIPFNGNV